MPDLARLYRRLSFATSAPFDLGVSGQRLGIAGGIAALCLIIACQKCEVCFAMARDFARCAAASFFRSCRF